MEIEITRREMLSLAPGQFWNLPDEIANQLIARGSAKKPKVDIPDEKVLRAEVKSKK